MFNVINIDHILNHMNKDWISFLWKCNNFALLKPTFQLFQVISYKMLPSPIFHTTIQKDKKEKPMCKRMEKIIENIIVFTKRKQGEKTRTELADSMARKIEEELGGFWVVFITPFVPFTKQISECGSSCEHVEGTHCFVSYEGEIYKIFQSHL